MKYLIMIYKDGKPDLKQAVYAHNAKSALKIFWSTCPWVWGENAETLDIKIEKSLEK